MAPPNFAKQGTEGGAALLEQLPTGHVIHTLVSEHVQILGFLRQVDDLNTKLSECGSREAGEPVLAELVPAAQNLVDAEKHHAREEEALFPEMESRGVSGPTTVMRQEHEFLRPLKQRLLDQARTAPGDRPFDQLKKAISDTAVRLVPNLVAHIQKEDSVLYPMALQVIPDAAVWEGMKVRCDEIGYCPFTE